MWSPISLVAHFVEVVSRRMGKRIDRIRPATMAAFEVYDGPGNVRELQNLVERVVILTDDGVLPNPARTAGGRADDGASTLRDSERALILGALEAVGWDWGAQQASPPKGYTR
jgi:DNA-binding NtrC family response regulator